MSAALTDLDAWLSLAGAERRARLMGALGDGWIVDAGTGDRQGPDAQCVHVASGKRFFFVPGGMARVGASDDERAALTALCDTLSGEQAEALAMVLASELPAPREVEIEPFLLAASVLDFADAAPVLGLPPGARMHPDGLSRAEAEAVAASFAPELRLPSDHEWERAYRAGAVTPFPWGSTPPADPAIPQNALGFRWMAELYELCADPDDRAAHTVRGGAAIHWPWHGVGEWIVFLSAYRERPTPKHDGWLQLRLARACSPLPQRSGC
jgi:hypothetical protein